MKKLLTLVLIGLFLGIVPKVWAQGVGSPECLMVQLDAQAAVTAGGPYLRHGHLVRTAAAVVDAAVVAGDIDEECASCIMNQFARGIPIAEQTACGEEACEVCEGDFCADQTECGEDCFNLCPAGGGSCFCHQEISCTDATPCVTDSDCPTDWRCSHSCCGEDMCHPSCGVFPVGVVAPLLEGGAGNTSVPSE